MANRIKESNITPGAVTSDKIAPGTVSASNISPGSITTTQIATDTIASSNIAPGTIANDRLANTGITINGTTIALGASGNIVAGTDWQAVVTADGSTATTASAGEGYFIDTTSNAHTVTLPSSPTQGDEVHIVDYAGTFGSNNVTVGRNGSNIDGTASDGTLATNRLNVRFVYIDATQGWKAIFDDASASYGVAYITATGGTVTTSGDFKIHTFTGDGCFVVSSLGTGVPCAQASTVDYLVVAGGGGSGTNAGGAGAGGFRESKDSTLSSPHTASPLAATTGLTISSTTYPVTVGAGGAGNIWPTPVATIAPNGSNSVFSTITSAGGGGTGGQLVGNDGSPGGSGGGAPSPAGNSGGTGNTPPVSPPQGSPGGSTPSGGGGAGGGGATAAGSNYTTPGGTAPGGNGATTSISGSPTGYAGGGGGGSDTPGASPSSGGSGGGGDGGTRPCAGAVQSGTANTGGGAGGMGESASPGTQSSGGKGIVIIRYKFQ